MDLTSNKKINIAIIGGGFTGLSAAHRLKQLFPNSLIVVLESQDRLGGLGTGFREPEWGSALEKYYHHWFKSDAEILSFLDDLGLKKNIFFKKMLTVIETINNGFVQLDTPFTLLKYPELSFLAKIRMACCLLYLKINPSWRHFERVTAYEWCKKWMGDSGFQAIWKPLLEGKFGQHYAPKINMAWLWARLFTRTKELGSYRGGFLQLAEDIARALVIRGIEFKLNIVNLSLKNKTLYSNSEIIGTFDAILVAAQPGSLKSIAGEMIPPSFLEPLLQRPYLGVKCMIYSLKRALNQGTPNYWYSLKREGIEQPFLALIEHTNFFSPKEFNGEHLVYIASYIEQNGTEWNWTEEQWHDKAFAVLKKISPDLELTDINRKWSFSENYAQPIVETFASEKIPPLRVPNLEGLYFASMAHIYPWDRGTNFAVELGKQLAETVYKDNS